MSVPLRLGVVSLLLLGSSTAAAVAAPPPDSLPRHARTGTPGGPTDSLARQEVLAVLERMVDAMEKKDTAALRSTFEPGARLVGLRARQGGQALQTLSVSEFADFVARDTRDRWVERLREPEVRIEGTLATVWAGYDFYFGTRLSHCGTDAFQLLHTAEGWKIVSLADTYRTEGCRER